ncbi:MAG: hypothetical protein ABI843_09140 [Dokdonella sp.]
MQLAIGVQSSYARSTRVRDAGLVAAVAEAWTAMQPLLGRLQMPSGERGLECAAVGVLPRAALGAFRDSFIERAVYDRPNIPKIGM